MFERRYRHYNIYSRKLQYMVACIRCLKLRLYFFQPHPHLFALHAYYIHTKSISSFRFNSKQFRNEKCKKRTRKHSLVHTPQTTHKPTSIYKIIFSIKPTSRRTKTIFPLLFIFSFFLLKIIAKIHFIYRIWEKNERRNEIDVSYWS